MRVFLIAAISVTTVVLLLLRLQNRVDDYSQIVEDGGSTTTNEVSDEQLFQDEVSKTSANEKTGILHHQSQIVKTHDRYSKANSVRKQYLSVMKEQIKQIAEFLDTEPYGPISRRVSEEEKLELWSNEKQFRELERRMFDEVSSYLSQEELLDYKIEHSLTGKLLTRHIEGLSRSLSITVPQEDIRSFYTQREKFYEILDREFGGSSDKFAEFCRKSGEGRFEPYGPERDLLIEIIEAHSYPLSPKVKEHSWDIASFDMPSPLTAERIKNIYESME